MKDDSIRPTPDEIISTLRRSSLPTLIIEGDTDAIVFRPLEELLFEMGVSVMPVGGRTCLLEVLRRLDGEAGPWIFFADKDLWVLSGVPAEFNVDRLILTSGYSIENDIYLDGNLEQYLSRVEREAFKEELDEFVRWFAIAAARALKGTPEELGWHPNAILDDAAKKAELSALGEDEEDPRDLYNCIMSNYASCLRGKSLLALLIRHLSYSGRPVRHRVDALIDIVAHNRGPLLGRAYQAIAEAFRDMVAPTGEAPAL